MNEYDSNRIYDTVKKIGYLKTDNKENVDCYIINTCHIRDKAKEKVYHEVGRIREIYKSRNKPITIIRNKGNFIRGKNVRLSKEKTRTNWRRNT